MMRYHPWTWRPGTLPGMGAAEWLHDMLNTRRPLEEKMALFWHQVFATGVSKVDHYDDVMDMIVKFRDKGDEWLNRVSVFDSQGNFLSCWDTDWRSAIWMGIDQEVHTLLGAR